MIQINVGFFFHFVPCTEIKQQRPAATTAGGALRLTIEKVNPIDNHDLSYRSGMVIVVSLFALSITLTLR